MDLKAMLAGVKPEENNNRDYIPAGKYNVVIEKIEPKKNDTGWAGLNFQLSIFGDKYNNKKMIKIASRAVISNNCDAFASLSN